MRALRFLSLASLTVLAACSSSSSPAVVNDATPDVASNDGSNDAADSAADAPSDATDAAAEASIPLDCTDYCAAIQGTCSGARAQYTTIASCLGTCSAFKLGMAGDTSGDTLACRVFHAQLAMSDPSTHCPHAGPSGGARDPAGTTPAPCGPGCDAFCTIAMKACVGTYADMSACMTDCASFHADATDYNTADTSTNDFGCRLYHLTIAATDASAAAIHCAHIVGTSTVCAN